MTKKKKFLKQFAIGEGCTHEPFSFVSILEEKPNMIFIKVSDSSGYCKAVVSRTDAEKGGLFELAEGTVINVNASFLLEGIEMILKIYEFSICTDYIPAEIFPSISAEIVESCKAGIRNLQEKISHPGFHALIEACLTDAVLDRMAELPATLNSYGKYNGGSLVATNAISHMVLTSMSAYSKRGNALTTVPPSWNVLTTAALLFLYGNVEFFTPTAPYKRSKLGVAMGYTSLLQKMIVDKVHEKNIPLSDDDLASLLNILKVTTEEKTSVRATSKDGSILRHMVSLYKDCDTFDWDIATHERDGENESYYYSPALKSYVVLD